MLIRKLHSENLVNQKNICDIRIIDWLDAGGAAAAAEVVMIRMMMM